MSYLVYVIKEPSVISYLEDYDLEGLKALLSEDDTLLFDEPVEFNTEAEALAFCAGLGYGVDERSPVEVYPLRDFEEADKTYIELIKNY